MSCKGKTGKALERCMKSYVKSSKRKFPTFNKKKDTVITTSGKGSRSAVMRHNRISAQKYNPPKLNSQKTSSYTDGTHVASTITKKKK